MFSFTEEQLNIVKLYIRYTYNVCIEEGGFWYLRGRLYIK